MLRLSRAQSEAIVDHAMTEAEREDGPREAVGAIACHVESGECRIVRFDNTASNPEADFKVAERDVYRFYKDMDARREFLHVLYHSHTRVEAIPSANDVANAEGLEDVHYLVVATAGRGRALRSWRIIDGQAAEEPIEFV